LQGAEYKGHFQLPAECQSPKNEGKLVFEGLDTYCDIYLNGNKILSTNNMFRRYEVNVKNLFLVNNITLRFNSSAVMDVLKQKEFYDAFGFNLPANFSFSRKAAYQYGWDWGPRIVNLGIWKPISLRCRLLHSISNFSVRLLTPITQRNPASIKIAIHANITNVGQKLKYSYWIALQNSNHTVIFNISNSTNSSNLTNFEIYKEVSLSDYSKNLSEFVWWTWDLGKPVVFNLTLSIPDPHTNTKINQTIFTGFRTVKLIQEKDYEGTSFYFNLNGYSIFMRGANYIPPEMMMDVVTSATYTRIK
jgi:beta-mannosidase